MKKIHILLLLILTFISCQKEYEKGKTTFELGKIYSTNKELYDYSKAMKYYEKAIKDGEKKAYYELAQLYMSPEHFYPKDYKSAKKYLELALKNGDKRANLQLGIIESFGLVGARNEYLGEKYLIEEENPIYLLRLYGSEDSKLKDYKKAFELALKNSSLESHYTNQWLEYFYKNGYGTKKDLKKSTYYKNLIMDFNGWSSESLLKTTLRRDISNRYKLTLIGDVNKHANGFVTLDIPPSIKGIQKIISIKYTEEPYKREKHNGFESVIFKLNGKKKTIKAEIVLDLFNYPQGNYKNMDSIKFSPLDITENKFINLEKLKNISKKLKGKNELDTLSKVAFYTLNSLEYKKQNSSLLADKALEWGNGDCTEFSSIFAGLLTNLGITTKVVTGITLDKDLHAWNLVETKSLGVMVYDVTNSISSLTFGALNNNIIFTDRDYARFFDTNGNSGRNNIIRNVSIEPIFRWE